MDPSPHAFLLHITAYCLPFDLSHLRLFWLSGSAANGHLPRTPANLVFYTRLISCLPTLEAPFFPLKTLVSPLPLAFIRGLIHGQ